MKTQAIQEKFLTQLQSTTATIDQDNDVEVTRSKFKENIENKIEQTVGFVWSSVSKKQQTPWWSEEVCEKVKTKQKAFQSWMKHGTPENRTRYVEAQREAEKKT